MVLKYTSHCVYCVLLCVLLSRYEALDDHDADSRTLVWFLRVFVTWNVCHLFAAIVLFDLNGTRYSRGSESLKRIDAMPILLYALALVANVSACSAGMWVNRVIWRFPLRLEIAGAALLLFACNAANIAYNAASFLRLQPFFASKGIDLRRHQRWSYALTNVGSSFRAFKRVLVFALSRLIATSVPTLAQLLPTWQYPTVWAGFVIALITPVAIAGGLFQFHLAHSWLHSNATLYHLVHKVHHLARYPIPSDAGTESPLEFMLDEITPLTLLGPFWLWLPGEAFIMRDHRTGHTFELGNKQLRAGEEGPAVHHMLHHTKNAGNLSIIPYDKLFGTLMDSTKISAFELPLPRE